MIYAQRKIVYGDNIIYKLYTYLYKKVSMSEFKYESEYNRECPQCGDLIFHKNERALKQAIRNGSKPCKKCTAKNQYEKRVREGTWNCTNKGQSLKRDKPKFWKLCPTDGCVELMGYTTLHILKQNPTTVCKKCARNTDEVNNKLRLAIKNESAETKRRRRTSAIKRLERNITKEGKMLAPNYNLKSIPILEQVAKDLGITDLQHAENGGEFYIKELGYWVDGYSKEKNIVFEFDEPGHFSKDGLLKRKDQIRQKEIEEYLNCIFIRIRQ
jgi:hypothetical protein